MMKLGKAKKGDGTHVDHVKALDSGGSMSLDNLRVVKARVNLDKEIKRKRSKPGNN